MEQPISGNLIPKGKIYKDRAIYVGTLLGGPMVAGYLIATNFKNFNEPGKVKKTWLYAILSTIIIFGGMFLIPEGVKFPGQIIPLTYTAIAYFVVQHFQGQQITAHLSAGGQFYSWGRTIGTALIGLIITLIPILAISYFSDSQNTTETSKVYGTMKHQIYFNESNITEREVDSLADGFIKTHFFDDAATKYVYAKKTGYDYELSISCNNSITGNAAAQAPFIQLRTDMQSLFPNNKIIFNLVVDSSDLVIKRLE